MTEAWRAEHARWCARDLSDVDYVYIWADGIYVNVRLPDATGAADRLCLLVIVGVRPDGTKELVAVTDGHREDTQCWLDLLRDLRDRGMTAPELAVVTAPWGSGAHSARCSARRGCSAAGCIIRTRGLCRAVRQWRALSLSEVGPWGRRSA